MKNTIKGIIKDEKGVKLSGIPISVFDVKPGKETLLEQGLTGE